ncbi:MAG: preprotein translocase subunit SecG [Dehalococcoidia bacterium]|nr:preprotein translocase subunit SecG [Dehalococcoidia bacterium]MDD5493238.1 preprotein translocase subunit SecG [Dehalococcoidia bacterium]
MPVYLIVAQILVALALIAVLSMQVKGGGLGGIFGQSDGVYRTRRGVEKTLFQVTIVLSVIFVVLSVVIVKVTSG